MTCKKVDFIESLYRYFLDQKVTDFSIGSDGEISKMIFFIMTRGFVFYFGMEHPCDVVDTRKILVFIVSLERSLLKVGKVGF